MTNTLTVGLDQIEDRASECPEIWGGKPISDSAKAIQGLKDLAQAISPEQRVEDRALLVKGGISDNAPSELNQELRDLALIDDNENLSFGEFLEAFDIETLRAVAGYTRPETSHPSGFPPWLALLSQKLREGLLRSKLHVNDIIRLSEYIRLKLELQDSGLLDHRGNYLAYSGGSKDAHIGSSPEHTRLNRALRALEEEKSGQHVTSELQEETRRFVLGILNPQPKVELLNISDVFGAEANTTLLGLPAENDLTRLRTQQHHRELSERYGIEIKVVNQGTSINCPEQCGFYGLAAINQARRADLKKLIKPRFLVLNNAARVEEADGISGGVKESKSSSLLWFEFDLGDGVKHNGVAYGHRTLTHLKPYITKLYEIDGTDSGSQFRSLEIEQHIAVLSASADGALPTCYPVAKQDLDVIPGLKLAANEAQFLGVDKYGNGLLSKPWKDLVGALELDPEDINEVSVAFGDGPRLPYQLVKHLGDVRNGGDAIWEGSTPSTEDPRDGFASIGVCKKERSDIPEALLTVPEGTIVKVIRTHPSS